LVVARREPLVNNRVPTLRLASVRPLSALTPPSYEGCQAALAMPANGPSRLLRLVTTRDASGDSAPAAVDGTANYEAMFVASLDVVERVIRYVCQRHKLAGPEADDFGSEVKIRLIDNDYEVFRKFQQRSSLRTYLTIVIQRIYLDYRNHVWGKWRPSAEAQRLGPIAMQLERLMRRDGLGFEEACEHLRTNEGVRATDADLAALFVRLPVRTRRAMVSDDALEALPDRTNPADDGLLSTERQAAARRILDALTTAVRALGDQDRVILRLRFQDGLAVADIARALHLDQKTLYRRFDALLRRLRVALEAAGVDREEATEIVNRKDVDISLALLGGPPEADGPAAAPDPSGAEGTPS
jgi:RNA polymerase sigma factor (sigma-70 family)